MRMSRREPRGSAVPGRTREDPGTEVGPQMTAHGVCLLLIHEGAPFAFHDVGEGEGELFFLLVDGAVELGDELFVVLDQLFFEGLAGGVAERADEGAVKLAETADAEVGDF
jgi:hypothetical protein